MICDSSTFLLLTIGAILTFSPISAFTKSFLLIHPLHHTNDLPAPPPIDRLSVHTSISKPQSSDGLQIKTTDVLSLESIRSSLIRQEETIIFSLIERAQFRRNAIVYARDGFRELGVPPGMTTMCGEDYQDVLLSFLEYMIIGTEILHCGVRRYTSPEEHAFFQERLPSKPLAALPSLDYPTDLLSPTQGANSINFNPSLLYQYVTSILPNLTQPGDDEQHGSTVLADIAVLQALSRRVHYGKFVAESKYLSDPEGYMALVQTDDTVGVMERLTNVDVERNVLRRAKLKAATYGQEPLIEEALGGDVRVDPSMEQEGGKVAPAVIESIYKNVIIPLTKDIEVAYLYARCGRNPTQNYGPDQMVQPTSERNERRDSR